MTYPNSKEHLVVDRITDKKNFYKNEAKASPYLGFNFYDKDYFECASKIDQIVIENLNVWKSNDINSEFERINKKLRDAGIDELLVAVNRQLNEWKEISPEIN